MRYLYPYKCSLTGKQLVLLTIQAYIGVLSFFPEEAELFIIVHTANTEEEARVACFDTHRHHYMQHRIF